MTACVLVVDDNAANRELLEARLNAEYFQTLTVGHGEDAIAMCEKHRCDIVLLDDKMPGMDGFEACRRLKGQISTAHIPIIMVSAFDQPGDHVRALDAGADDFLVKPIDEVHLMARIRSLTRLKIAMDELRSRAKVRSLLDAKMRGAVDEVERLTILDKNVRGRVLILDDKRASAEAMARALSANHTAIVEPNAQEALFKAAEDECDIIVISLALANYDALRMCSQVRALERTRHLPILVVADAQDQQRVLRAFEFGVNGVLNRPVDGQELVARVRSQVRLGRYAESLRNLVFNEFAPSEPQRFLFISHVSEDFPVAIAIVEDLQRRGVKCWIAPRDIRPGQPFDDEISNAIDGCLAMILVFSDRCNESDYVRRELTVAGDAGKMILPVRIEDVQPKRGLRLRLSDLHWIDAFYQREAAIERLVEIIGGLG